MCFSSAASDWKTARLEGLCFESLQAGLRVCGALVLHLLLCVSTHSALRKYIDIY